jgi:hypothetical protein
MLPVNTQAQANTEKLILDTLVRQGEELSKQSKNLEKLAMELNKQRRTTDKVITRNKASDSTDGPGILDTPMKDLLKMFKFESGDDLKQTFGKRKPSKSYSNRSQESEGSEDRKSKDKMEDESQNILKSILDKFTESSEFQRQMSENNSKLLTSFDLTEKNIAVVKDDIGIIRKSFEENEQDSLAQRMGKAVADNIAISFAPLLKTADFKQFTKEQTTRIVDALDGMGGGDEGGDGGGFDIPGMPGGGGSKGGAPKGGAKPNKGNRTVRRAKVGARSLGRGIRRLPWGRIALGAATGAILYEGLTHAEELNTGEQEEIDQFKENNPELFKTDQDILNDPNADKKAKAIAEKNIKLQEDIKKYGVDEARQRAEARDSIEERLRQRKVEKEKIAASRDKSMNADEIGNQIPKQKYTKEMSPQAPLVIPEEMKNLNNDTSKLNQMNVDETGKALTPVSAEAPKLLNTVTEQKQELIDNKQTAAPITVINNNTNNVAGTGSGQSMTFAAATPINPDTSINDFFRSHGRIFA